MKKGFTLIELLIVIGIIGILLSIGVSYFIKDLKKRNMENDIEKIFSTIQKYRIKAFLEKKIFVCKFSSDFKEFQIYDENNVLIDRVKLKEKFNYKSDDKLVINTRGILSGSSIKPLETISSLPEYNCLSIDNTGIKFGIWENDKCIQK